MLADAGYELAVADARPSRAPSLLTTAGVEKFRCLLKRNPTGLHKLGGAMGCRGQMCPLAALERIPIYERAMHCAPRARDAPGPHLVAHCFII